MVQSKYFAKLLKLIEIRQGPNYIVQCVSEFIGYNRTSFVEKLQTIFFFISINSDCGIYFYLCTYQYVYRANKIDSMSANLFGVWLYSNWTLKQNITLVYWNLFVDKVQK